MPRSGRIAEFAGYRLDLDERSLLTPSGGTEQLSSRLFETLALLLERAGQVVEKRELLAHVWKDVVVEENTLSRTVSSLREKLGESSGAERVIETVSGLGYRLRAPVRYTKRAPEAASADVPMLAVLPFDDLSADHDQRYLVDGFADELIAALTGLPSLRITSRGSAFQLRGADARIARERLGATHVITGSVRRQDDRLRAAVQLVDAATERPLWATQRDGRIDDLFALQASVAEAVRAALVDVLSLAAPELPARRIPDATAYDLYLRARATAHASGGPAIAQACALLRQAVNIDPEFALAWSQLSLWSRGMMLFGVPTTEDLARTVEHAAERAMTLEPDGWPAHVAQSSLSHLRRDWLGMERALQRARELAGSHPAELMIQIASHQLFVGRPRTALASMREAVLCDPLSLIVSGAYQLAMHVAGDEAGAQREYDRSRTLTGNREMVEHLAIHRRWVQRLPFDDELERCLQHEGTELSVFRRIAAVHDDSARAVAVLSAALSDPVYAPPARQLMLAWWLAHYSAVDEAMRVLWRVHVDQGHVHTSWLWFPVLTEVRKLRRFAELVDQLGFTRYWEQSGCGPEVPGFRAR